MSIITPTDLLAASSPAFLIQSAQYAVEVYCYGVTGRMLANVTQAETLAPRQLTAILPLTRGPATRLLSVFWNGADRTADWRLFGPFGVECIAVQNGLPVRVGYGDTVTISYTQGYASETAVPDVLKTAVTLLAADPTFRASARAISSKRLGDAQVTYNASPMLPGGVSASVAGLLASSRDPALIGL
jgi:hypothetical protein